MKRYVLLLLALSCSIGALAHPSVSVVVDSHGNVFYSDLKQVWRIDKQGAKTVAVANVHTHELWLDASDSLYGEHLWYTGPQDGSGKWFHRVWKRTPDGRLSDVLPAREGFRTDFSFVRDAAGNGYMAGDSVGTKPKFVRMIDSGGHSRVLAKGFEDIRWMSVGPDGNLYLVDNGKIRRVTREGAVSTLASSIAEHSRLAVTVGREHDLMGLTADTGGNVYVAVYGAQQIKKIGADGKVTVFDRSTLPWSPTGIAVAGKTAFILEYADPLAVRVRRVEMK